MMKIAIIGFGNIKYMPYLHFYLNSIDKKTHDVHLIYWSRDCKADSTLPEGITTHSFEYPLETVPLMQKLPGIIKYANYVNKMIREINPDFLIVLLATTAVSIFSFLMGKYRKRYIFDFRDITYEHIPLYRKMVEKVVNNAVLSFTSSEGFKKFLPDTPTLLSSHNISNVSLRNGMSDKRSGEKHTPIRLSYWGMIRNYEINRELIKKLGGDKRFELHYYGRADGKMLALMEKSTKMYNNVFFHGEYEPSDRLELALQTDMIHNIFDRNDKTMPIAMSNKYYDGLLFSLPQLTAKGSHMASFVTKNRIGLECDPYDEDFADAIYDYYLNLNFADLQDQCEKELARVLREVESGSRAINEVLRNA